MKLHIPKQVKTIANKLSQKGYSCFIAGGWCRDYHFDLCHSERSAKHVVEASLKNDIDLFTDAHPDEVKKILKVVGEVGKKYGTCIITEGKQTYEITTFRRDIGSVNNRKPAEVIFTKSLEEDARRRDFTCNAIYYDILEEIFIDPTGGREDIKKGVIRFVGNPEERLEEDILRLLRYVRIKYKYNLKDAEKNYTHKLSLKIELLRNIAIERIKEEFEKILLLCHSEGSVAKSKNPLNNENSGNIGALQTLKLLGFFKLFLPEVEVLSSTPGGAPRHLEGDVWTHTLMTIHEMNKLTICHSREGGNLGKGKKSFQKNTLDLLWTMLIHDTGKALCVTYDDTGRIHYYGHEQISANIFSSISKRWRFSNSSHKKIHWLIDNHLRVGHSLRMHKVKIHRYMMEKYYPALLLVYEADKRGREPVFVDGFVQTQKYFKAFQKKLGKITFFTGQDVMKKHPEAKGKHIGEILEQWNNKLLEEIKISIE